MNKLKLNKISNIFFYALKDDNSDLAEIYTRLFELCIPEQLNSTLEYTYNLYSGTDSYYKKAGKDCWFGVFHKSIRQTDFFEELYALRESEIISTDDEKSKFKYLRNKVKEKDYNKYGDKSKGELFTEEYSEYLDLSRKVTQKKDYDSIAGTIDSILWSLINHDNTDILYNLFLKTFYDYNFYLKTCNSNQ